MSPSKTRPNVSATKSGKKLSMTPSFQFAARIWRRECQVSMPKAEGKHKGRIKSGGRAPPPDDKLVSARRRQAGEPNIQILQAANVKLAGRANIRFAAFARRCAIWLLKLRIKHLNERHVCNRPP